MNLYLLELCVHSLSHEMKVSFSREMCLLLCSKILDFKFFNSLSGVNVSVVTGFCLISNLGRTFFHFYSSPTFEIGNFPSQVSEEEDRFISKSMFFETIASGISILQWVFFSIWDKHLAFSLLYPHLTRV